MEAECAICLEPCSKLSVKCCNGHEVCEKHFLQRYKAIYEEGRLAFKGDNAQRCFVCRQKMHDNEFSDTYFKNLRLVIFITNAKNEGINYHEQFENGYFAEITRKMKELTGR